MRNIKVIDIWNLMCFTNTLELYDHNMILYVSENNQSILDGVGSCIVECVEGYENKIVCTIPENSLIEYYD